MIKKISLMSLALAISFMFIGISETKAQVSVSNVMKRAQAVIDKLEETGAQVLYVKVDTIEKDDIALDKYVLSAGSEYAVIAIGDAERIKDIDLAVLDANNVAVGKDNDDSNLAIVKFIPKKTQSFNIGVKGYKMDRNDGFYAIIICRLDK